MADALYPTYKESALSQNPSVDLDTDTIKVAAVDLTTDYTYSAAHQYKSSVTSYTGTTDQTLSAKTVTSGVFDDTGTVTFSALSQSASKTIGALVIYKDTGVAGTSPLIAYIDSFTEVTPNGGDVTVTWNASGIFAL